MLVLLVETELIVEHMSIESAGAFDLIFTIDLILILVIVLLIDLVLNLLAVIVIEETNSNFFKKKLIHILFLSFYYL
jgi:hypothetical protein